MRRSEIFAALTETYGADYGYSLACDLSLQQLGGKTLLEALETNVDLDQAWAAFCDEMDADASVRFHHRYRQQR